MNGGEQREPGGEPNEKVLRRALPPDGGLRPREVGEGPPGQPEEREADDDRPTPRIYVASLSDYNAGDLHGEWIDAAQEVDELYVDISLMLADSPILGTEEWAIHDYDGFGPLVVNEYETVETVSRLGLGIAEHGLAFGAWASHVGTGEDVLGGFDEAYLGEWPSAEAYAEVFLEQLGLEEIFEGLPAWLKPHVSVDLEGFALSLETNGDIWTAPTGEGSEVYVFVGDGVR